MASRRPDDVGGPGDALNVTVCAGTPPIVVIGGVVDVLSAPYLREELLRLIRRRGPQLALDLNGVTFMDCAGIEMLVATRRRAQLEGGWLRIVRASPPAGRTIRLLGLQKALALGAPALLAPVPNRQRTAGQE
jgi:anti-sigma B factor antagonist